MNSKLVNPSMTTYNNWQTKGRRMHNKKIFEEQKSSVERLSHSPRLDLYDSESTLQKQLSSCFKDTIIGKQTLIDPVAL
jgi:hypothetical protein